MNASPIDSYDGAEVYFTFGGGSVGMWIFLVLAAVLFVYVGVRAAQFESSHFAEVIADSDALESLPSSSPGRSSSVG